MDDSDVPSLLFPLGADAGPGRTGEAGGASETAVPARQAGATAPWKAWTIWQSGESGSHDNDVFNGTPAELTAWISSFQPHAEVDVQSGQLNAGANAVTVIAVPHGTGTTIVFGCDNGVQGLPPAVLRVAIHDQNGWHITNNVTVDSTKGESVQRTVELPSAVPRRYPLTCGDGRRPVPKNPEIGQSPKEGQTGLVFADPGTTGVISVHRQDASQVVVGWAVS